MRQPRLPQFSGDEMRGATRELDFPENLDWAVCAKKRAFVTENCFRHDDARERCAAFDNEDGRQMKWLVRRGLVDIRDRAANAKLLIIETTLANDAAILLGKSSAALLSVLSSRSRPARQRRRLEARLA